MAKQNKDVLNRRLSALTAAKPMDAPPPKSKRRVERSAERKSAYRFARLILPDGATVNCIVKDISAKGAKVMIEGNFGLPQKMILKIDQTGQSVRAGLVWQDETEAGLAFVH